MRLLFLNQFGGESGAPTGRILADLAAALRDRGHEVVLLATDTSYGKPSRGLVRIVREGISHLVILGRGCFCPKVDAVLSLSSPACLAVTAGLVARIHRAKHFHWAMDLYPDVGAILGELKSRPLVAVLKSLMRRAYHDADGIITLDEDMREYLNKNYGIDSLVIAPFPPDITWPVVAQSPNGIRRWLYSGNFGRAHEIQVLLQVQKKLEERQVGAELILQGQGPQFVSSQEAANQLGLKQVQWRAPVPLEKLGSSLLESDVLVVTRKAEMKGLLLPSKLMLAELSGKSILWIGDTDGKTAQRLAREQRHGVFTMDEAESIASWLQRRFALESPQVTLEPKPPRLVRQETVRQWEALLPGARN